MPRCPRCQHSLLSGKGQFSKGRWYYGKVVRWIDPRKMIPLRVEKFDNAGKLVRRIETTQTAKDDRGLMSFLLLPNA